MSCNNCFSFRHCEDWRKIVNIREDMLVAIPKQSAHNTRCYGREADLSFVQIASRAASAFSYHATHSRSPLAMTDARGKNANTLSLRNDESRQLLNRSLKGFNLNSPGLRPGNTDKPFTEPQRGSTPKQVLQLHSRVQPLRSCDHPFNCYPPVSPAAIQIEARRASL